MGAPRLRAAAWFLVVGGAAVATLPPAGVVWAESPVTFGFGGSAGADGVRMRVTIPGFPVTDSPFDAGGPTAQAALDSLGTSTGYAALPDPGGLVITGPGLLVGLLASGAGGLPPVLVPSPPPYPLYVSSTAPSAPKAAAGSGPYRLSASSSPTVTEAEATAGLQPESFGRVGLSTSTTSVTAADDQVVARAVATSEGLSVGPLTIGQVKSTAVMTMNSSGVLTPQSSTEITGANIGGTPVQITPNGLTAGEQSVPVPVQSTITELLEESGISVRVLPEQRFPDRVIAPTIEISFPFSMPEIPNVGKFDGTATMSIGFAVAQLSGEAPPPLIPDLATPGLAAPVVAPPGQPVIPPPGGPDLSGGNELLTRPNYPLPGSTARPTPAGADPGLPSGASAQPEPVSEMAGEEVVAVRKRVSPLRLGIGNVYLLIVGGTGLVVGLGHLMRRVGERRWISTVG